MVKVLSCCKDEGVIEGDRDEGSKDKGGRLRCYR